MTNSSPQFKGYDDYGQMLPNPPKIPTVGEMIKEMESRAIEAEWQGDYDLASRYYLIASHYKDMALKGEIYAPQF